MSEDSVLDIAGVKDSNVLVLGDSGTGKTSIIAKRASILVESGVKPESVTVISYNLPTANNLVDRINNCITSSNFAGKVKGVTLQSFCFSIIRNHADLLGLDGLTVIDYLKRRDVVSMAASRLDVRGSCNYFVEVYDYQRSHLCSIENAIKEVFSQHYKAYKDDKIEEYITDHLNFADSFSEQKRELKLLDLLDMYSVVCDALENHPELGYKIFGEVSNLLVDDIQECDYLQIKFLMLVGRYCNLFMTADPGLYVVHRQAGLYNTVSYALTHYPQLPVYRLSQGYRMTQSTVDFVKWLFSKSKYPIDLTLSCPRQGTLPHFFIGSTYADVQDHALGIIKEHIQSGGKYSDILILGRDTYSIAKLNAALSSAGIPYRIYCTSSYPEQPIQLRKYLSAIRICANWKDTLAWDDFYDFAYSADELGDVCYHCQESMMVLAGIISKPTLDDALTLLEGSSLYIPWVRVLRRISLVNDPAIAMAISKEEFMPAMENHYQKSISKVHKWISALEDKALLSDSLQSFVREAFPIEPSETIYTIYGEKESVDAVRISSVYAAKSMEAKLVIIPEVGLGEWRFHQGIYAEDWAEDGRALLYAAVSRSSDKVCILGSEEHVKYSEEKKDYYILKDVPSHLVDSSI